MGQIALLSLFDSFPFSAQAGCSQAHLAASQDPVWQDGSHCWPGLYFITHDGADRLSDEAPGREHGG